MRPEPHRSGSTYGTWRLYLVVGLASAASLALEIVAGRLLAPELGVSLYTWTSIIGVVLAGISLGNYLGGRLADRFPDPSTLGLTLLAASGTSFGLLGLVPVLSDQLDYLPLVPRILALNAGLFFLPSCLLGMVTPVAIKQALTNLTAAGSTVGRIYAVATAGSILGVYLTGFVLVATLGTRLVVLLVGGVLLALAVLFGQLLRARLAAGALLVPTLAIGGYALQPALREAPCTVETHYYCIKVIHTDLTIPGAPKTLQLDHLIHGYVAPENPNLLRYEYTQVFAEAAQDLAQRQPAFQALFIGGGAYTVPLHLAVKYPRATIEVIEIDPGVTTVAYDELGVSPTAGIVTYNADARMAVQQLPKKQYDLIFGDAFNDFSVPYHLTTREFTKQLQDLLTDEGIYLVNVIDKLNGGRFLPAYIHTLQSLFPHVYILGEESYVTGDTEQSVHDLERDPRRERGTLVVAGSRQPLDVARFRSHRDGTSRPTTTQLSLGEQAILQRQGRPVLLTDDYAPVDTLTAPLFTGEEAQWRWTGLVPPSWRRWLR
ncbi:MAG: hypothetical protein CL878_06270 [Dehalococcoidia bacterium]|nr:hypothetical protein [Dehalococcoidia bacterium]